MTVLLPCAFVFPVLFAGFFLRPWCHLTSRALLAQRALLCLAEISSLFDSISVSAAAAACALLVALIVIVRFASQYDKGASLIL